MCTSRCDLSLSSLDADGWAAHEWDMPGGLPDLPSDDLDRTLGMPRHSFGSAA